MFRIKRRSQDNCERMVGVDFWIGIPVICVKHYEDGKPLGDRRDQLPVMFRRNVVSVGVDLSI